MNAMKNFIPILLAAVLGCCSVVQLTSCASSSDLAAGGVYAGDATLYKAAKTIVGSYDIFDTFVKWEYTNRPFLASTPAVKAAADNVRVNAKHWIESAIALRDAYVLNPTPDGRAKLLSAINVLQVALNEIAQYYLANLKPPAPAAPPSTFLPAALPTFNHA